MKKVKKGKVIKSSTGVLLLAGSKLKLASENGEVILDQDDQIKEYMLGSDIFIQLGNDVRLFEVE